MSGVVPARASGSRKAQRMDVDDDARSASSGSASDFADVAADDSSGVDDDSGDDYVDEDDGAPAAAQPVEDDEPRDDAIFHRIAGYVSASIPGEGGIGQGIGGESFQLDLAAIDDEELPQASKPRRRLQRVHRPTYEVQQLLGRANMAYITQNHEEAVKLFLEVIRHDPQVQASWTTLASVYDEMGQTDMSRQMRFCAAHIEEDPETWLDLAEQFRGEDNTAQALYCYRRAIKLDGSSPNLIWKLVDIYRQTGANNKAVEALKKIHRVEPTFLRDFNMLMEVHPIITESKQFAFGATAFGEAFVYNFATFDKPEDQAPENTMTIENIVIYVDYLLKSGDPETAVNTIHRGQRWLQGRKMEKGWDAVDDDSEYYPPPEDNEEDADVVEARHTGYELDNQLRYRLAIARLRLGQDDEAMIHINVIFDLDAMIHGDMFKELGEALMKRQLWETALECWAVLHDRDLEDEPDVIFKLAVCQHQLKRNAEAHESLKWVVEASPANVEARLELASVLEDMGKRTEALEIVSEVIRWGEGRSQDGQSKGERVLAQRLNKRVLEAQASSTMKGLWEDVQAAEEGINNGEAWALDKFIHAAGTMIETYRLAKSNFTKNRGITRVAKRRKYGAKNDIASQAQAMQDRLERTLGFEDDTPMDGNDKHDYEVIRQTQFYGIGCEDWLALTIKYCCVLMVKNEEDVAMDILEHVVWSGLFNTRRCEIALRLAIVACAARMRSYDRIADNCKRLSQMHQFRPEPLLLLLSALGGGFKQQAIWSNLALQKFLHREVRIYDEAVCGVKLRFNKRHYRWAQILTTGQSRRLGDIIDDGEDDDSGTPANKSQSRNPEAGGDEDDDGSDDDDGIEHDGELDEEVPKPTKHSPIFNTLYGQNMLTTKSYQSALFYFLRAYEVNEYDPFLCFLIAQAYLGRSLNRQSDNRHFQVAQGLAFLTRYRKLSPQDPQSLEEVEYNYGRAFHSLGITHLAVSHYERVLTSVRERMHETDDYEEREYIRSSSLAWESAHNLVLIYTSSGSLDLVRSRSEEWLALRD